MTKWTVYTRATKCLQTEGVIFENLISNSGKGWSLWSEENSDTCNPYQSGAWRKNSNPTREWNLQTSVLRTLVLTISGIWGCHTTQSPHAWSNSCIDLIIIVATVLTTWRITIPQHSLYNDGPGNNQTTKLKVIFSFINIFDKLCDIL